MRLKDHEVKSIVRVFQESLVQDADRLYLFGSRTSAIKKGGDIDLLVVVEDDARVEMLRSSKLRLVDQLHSQIGEQKIDLTITSRNKLSTDPFLMSIQDELVQLI